MATGWNGIIFDDL